MFRCEECGKNFSRKDNLSRHNLLHAKADDVDCMSESESEDERRSDSDESDSERRILPDADDRLREDISGLATGSEAVRQRILENSNQNLTHAIALCCHNLLNNFDLAEDIKEKLRRHKSLLYWMRGTKYNHSKYKNKLLNYRQRGGFLGLIACKFHSEIFIAFITDAYDIHKRDISIAIL